METNIEIYFEEVNMEYEPVDARENEPVYKVHDYPEMKVVNSNEILIMKFFFILWSIFPLQEAERTFVRASTRHLRIMVT